MVGIGVLRRPARTCVRLLRRVSQKVVTAKAVDPQWTSFLCNVCGKSNCLPRRRLVREDGHCAECQCYGRLRSMMYALTARFSPDETVLARMKPRKDIRGVGCSDWGYTAILAEKFDYVNTFYDESPQLDLCNVDWSRWEANSIDFITCTDVLEHVEPPVDRAFENMFRLLKPGGIAILTVPCSLDARTREHFADLYDWRIEEEGNRRVVVNRRRDGTIDRYDNPCFHGGIGLTLEFRLFSRQGLIDNAERAGLRVANTHDRSIEPYAIPLSDENFVLVAEKPAAETASTRVPPSVEPYQVLADCQKEITVRTSAPEPRKYGYAPKYRDSEFGYWAHIPGWVYQDFRQAADRSQKLRCLDVGCAYGTLLLHAIKSLRCEPYAIDFLRYLDASLIDDYDIHYQINNIEREAFPWQVQFDVILFTEVLEHLNFNAGPTLEKLRGLLKPGGRLYLSTPDASQWGRQKRYYGKYSDLPMPTPNAASRVIDDHVWQFDENELRRLIADAGFEITRFDYSSGLGKRHFNVALKASRAICERAA
jgi:2-polyprenyl-3-methyl-5-hydroxy-6-metoxy-1,4-benzoquinol methylase